jgi:hypothetical protein
VVPQSHLPHSWAMTLARPVAIAALATAAVAASACSSDDAGDAGTTDDRLVVRDVTVPPERQTPFCQAMIDLSETLETDPPDDVTAYIVSVYTGILDEVPTEIEDEFRVVLAELQGAPVPTATIDAVEVGSAPPTSVEQFDAEGYSPEDDPTLRVNAYVDFACRDSVNNPGPPATQPLDAALEDDAASDGG